MLLDSTLNPIKYIEYIPKSVFTWLYPTKLGHMTKIFEGQNLLSDSNLYPIYDIENIQQKYFTRPLYARECSTTLCHVTQISGGQKGLNALKTNQNCNNSKIWMLMLEFQLKTWICVFSAYKSISANIYNVTKIYHVTIFLISHD